MRSVYPRWRGEHNLLTRRQVFRTGLSPLARGTRRKPAPSFYPQRFIPAGAGNTAARSRSGSSRPVYPRWRGEHPTSWRVCTDGAGLSPLARGTHRLDQRCLRFVRFIPAGAGNTKSPPSAARDSRVYPRWRGEHVLCSFQGLHWAGLSPLARGTH